MSANTVRPSLDWQRHGIVMEPIEPWEGHSISNFTSAVEPIGRTGWRLWYTATDDSDRSTVALAEGELGGPWTRRAAELSSAQTMKGRFGISNLPAEWRPVQPVHIVMPDGRHRLYFWAHGPGVVRYLAAESGDGQRYTVLDPLRPVLWHPNDRSSGLPPVPGADGLTSVAAQRRTRPFINEPLAHPDKVCNDATNVYLREDDIFELYTVGLIHVPSADPRFIAHDNAPGSIRVIDRLESVDGINWEKRERVLEPRPEDPSGLQFYYLAVTHVPRGRVGMVGYYRCDHQTMDVAFSHSYDGLTWQPPDPASWLPRGEKDQPDSWGVYAPHSLIYRDDDYWLFYTAVNFAHNKREVDGMSRCVIMAASLSELYKQSE